MAASLNRRSYLGHGSDTSICILVSTALESLIYLDQLVTEDGGLHEVTNMNIMRHPGAFTELNEGNC
jgi:hypothetical protein